MTDDNTNAVRRRVLVIDDERAIVTAFGRLLGTQYDVVGLTDARQALTRIAEGERFDVILCDLFMPNMGGVEFHGQLSRIDDEAAHRVVFLSGGAYTETTQQFLARIPNRTIAKPLDSGQLLGLIESLVSDAER